MLYKLTRLTRQRKTKISGVGESKLILRLGLNGFIGIQLREDTEMGDNETIKAAQACEPCESNSRRAKKQEKAALW